MNKKCSRCQEYRDISEFSKNRCKKDGLNQECKICNRTSHRKAREKGLSRWYDLKKTLGISKTEYILLLQQQDYKCAICGHPHVDEKGSRLHVDHCHFSGKIRGLLCKHCNLGLGHFKDNRFLLHIAFKYLEKYNEEVL